MTQDPNTITMRLGLEDAQTMFPGIMVHLRGGDETDILGVPFRCVHIQTERAIPYFGAPEQWMVTLEFQRLFPTTQVIDINVQTAAAEPFQFGDAVILVEDQPMAPYVPNSPMRPNPVPRGCVGNVSRDVSGPGRQLFIPVDFGALGDIICDAHRLRHADDEMVARMRRRRWPPNPSPPQDSA